MVLVIIPFDPHARPIAGAYRALIVRAVMPSNALADLESFGLGWSHSAPRGFMEIFSQYSSKLLAVDEQELAWPQIRLIEIEGPAEEAASEESPGEPEAPAGK